MNVIRVNRDGSMAEVKLHDDEYFKKCGFRTEEGFELQHTWTEEGNIRYELHGKTKGKANSENKYEFPPPVAEALYFGKMLIMKRLPDSELAPLRVAEWNTIYEKLMGGFINLASEDESDEDCELPKTKEGYAKDDFVVSDSELLEEEY